MNTQQTETQMQRWTCSGTIEIVGRL